MSDGQPRNLLVEQNSLLDQDVKAALAEKRSAMATELLPQPSDYFAVRVDAEIRKSIADLGYDSDLVVIGQPTKINAASEGAALAFNAVAAAKALKASPLAVAENLADEISGQEVVDHAQATGPFVNICLDYSLAAPVILGEVEQLGERYGTFRDDQPKLVIVDYSSPNVAKNMTVAHLRSTIIGHLLMKLQAAVGNIPFGINHIGDWGTQFGKIIFQYQEQMRNRPDEFVAELHSDPTDTLMRIYREFVEREKTDNAAAESAREIFLRLEQGDPELVELWDKFRKWSLRDFGPTYDRLGIKFDAIQGESFYEDRIKPTIEDALARGVLIINDEGAIVFPSQELTDPSTGETNARIMFDQNGDPHDELIVKPSGGTVYLTRDLAAIRYRGEELGADKILYVIGKEQQAHCLKLFAMAHQLGYMALGSAEHISFGHLNVDGRKMKSRAGKVVLLNDLLDESIAAAESMLSARKIEQGELPDLTEAELEVARKIGVSSVIFNDIRQDRQRDIEFNPDMARTVEVGGATYIQYTDSRLKSIIERLGEPDSLLEMPKVLTTTEKRVIDEIARLPIVVRTAAEFNAPHKLAIYLTDFCRLVNGFYQDHPVAKAETATSKNFRLHLVRAAQRVIGNTSNLLHIELPGRM
jgi:arginyl-tRNA synthetase